MFPTLPSELWLYIFSYLDVEELNKARQVCRTWSELINYDRLWKPRLLARGISFNCIKLDNGEYKHEEGLFNQWIQLGSSYYRKLTSNWRNLHYSFSKFPRSTAGVAVHMPFIVWTFNPSEANFVEVLRVVNGNLVVEAYHPLPESITRRYSLDECYKPCMTSNSVFAVTMNATTIIFKLKDGRFSFAKAIQFTGSGSFFSTPDTEATPQFVFGWDGSRFLPSCSCCCVTNDVIWFQAIDIEGKQWEQTMFVWNYTTSQLLLRLEIRRFIGSSKNYVFLTTSDEGFSIYSLNGSKVWSEASEVTSVCWNNFGCAFIEIGGFPSVKARFLELPKMTSTNVGVSHAVAITLHKTDPFAYCLSLQGNTARLNCISLRNGRILWDIVAFPTPPSGFSTLFSYKLNVVLGKYITVFGMDDSLMVGDWNKLQLYSTSSGKNLGAINIKPLYELQHLSDEFILTGTSEHNGGWGFKYELYNFLCGKDGRDETTEAHEVMEE